MKNIKILIVSTSHDKVGTSEKRTGIWLEQLATPYYLFKDAGAQITIVSPKGGRLPVDPKSQSIIAITATGKRFLKDAEAMEFLATSGTLRSIHANEFDGVLVTGGHGAMWDLSDNTDLAQLLEAFYGSNKPVAAIAHGVISLSGLQNNLGELIVKGKQLTAFSNSEEKSSGLSDLVPFLVETKLRATGSIYRKGEDYTSFIIADGNIITGQNSASAEAVAKKMLSMLQTVKNTATQKMIN